MFSPLRSLENHYATKTLREHRKAGQHYAEGDVEGFHKHEHRALRAARHADSVRTIGGEKENTTRTMSGGFGAPMLKAPLAPLQHIPQTMYLVPQLQVIPLAPQVMIEEIQSAPSMTSLTSSPFGQNVLLGGPMDFPAATSFSSDQGCGLPPLTFSRSFDAPLESYASALSASVASSQAAIQELQGALMDREEKMMLLQEARSYDQAELTVLRQQVEQMRAELEEKKSNRRSKEPVSPSSASSSTDSEDDGLGENDGSLRRPFAFDTNIFPLVDEGTIVSLNGSESSRLDRIFPPAFPAAAGGLPDGGLGYGGFEDPDGPSQCAQLPPRVGSGIPFVQSMGEFPGQLGGPGMMSGFGFNGGVPQSTTTPNVPMSGTLPGGEMIAESPAAGAPSATSVEDWSASAAYNPYLLSPRSSEYFDGLEVTSKNVTEEPTSALVGAGVRKAGSGDVYQRLLLPTGGDDAGRQKVAAGGSDPFAPPPPIEVSGVEGDVESAGQPPRHHHHHHLRHHIHSLNKPHHQSGHHHHHGGSAAKGSAPLAASGVRGRGNHSNATSSPRVGGSPARVGRSERKEGERERVQDQHGSDAEREINFYKSARNPTPSNTVVLDSASGASAPPPRTL